ncbi:MAG: 3-hydroxyanthranilate 3,4-dioxygenase [Planctomycetes bacterium]|nr:3-hydroxyanthranilate 3,4-dioxygenase [Planctomycetota bacterium]
MTLQAPFNLQTWINENRNLLKPPVGNHMLFNQNFMVMVVGGPNQRTDFHVNPTEELFYQLEGDIVLRVMEKGQPRDIPIKQGDMFLLPPGIPHSPQRPANTVGLVIERKRPDNADDHMRWFCKKCGAVIHDAEFHLVDLGKQLKPIIEEYKSKKELQTCNACGTVNE